jgi:hypothetical protein
MDDLHSGVAELNNSTLMEENAPFNYPDLKLR